MKVNGEMTLILRYFTECGSFGAHCVKVVGKTILLTRGLWTIYDYYV